MNEFYQSPEFYNAVAACTVALLGILFIIGLQPFKKKKRLVIADLAKGPCQPPKKEDPALLTAGDYFTFLSSMVRSSPTLEDLAETMPLIEAFFDKPYRVRISNYQLKIYYARLLEVYCNREKELVYTPVAIHSN
jgi:hypothetical protein